MSRLMRSLSTTYAMYFNKKYERSGSLFQDIYKAVWVGEGDSGDSYLLQLSRYIHLNPRHELTGINPVNWPYSSYRYFLDQKVTSWIDPRYILNYFQRVDDGRDQNKVTVRYRGFVEDLKENPRETVGSMAIE